jgi:hypothetical protein
MKTTLNLQDADTFYEQLLDAHDRPEPRTSELLNARLILLLANQVGDAAGVARVHCRCQRHPPVKLGDDRHPAATRPEQPFQVF